MASSSLLALAADLRAAGFDLAFFFLPADSVTGVFGAESLSLVPVLGVLAGY